MEGEKKLPAKEEEELLAEQGAGQAQEVEAVKEESKKQDDVVKRAVDPDQHAVNEVLEKPKNPDDLKVEPLVVHKEPENLPEVKKQHDENEAPREKKPEEMDKAPEPQGEKCEWTH